MLLRFKACEVAILRLPSDNQLRSAGSAWGPTSVTVLGNFLRGQVRWFSFRPCPSPWFDGCLQCSGLSKPNLMLNKFRLFRSITWDYWYPNRRCHACGSWTQKKVAKTLNLVQLATSIKHFRNILDGSSNFERMCTLIDSASAQQFCSVPAAK